MEHWAKIEATSPNLAEKRQRLRRRLPVEVFEGVRKELDPKDILANDAVRALFSTAK